MMKTNLLTLVVLALPLALADSPCCSDAAAETTPSAFETIKNWFDQGEDLAFEDIEGSFYLGRCYHYGTPDIPMAAIFGAYSKVDESHGSHFERKVSKIVSAHHDLLDADYFDFFTANQVQGKLEPFWDESKVVTSCKGSLCDKTYGSCEKYRKKVTTHTSSKHCVEGKVTATHLGEQLRKKENYLVSIFIDTDERTTWACRYWKVPEGQ